MTTHTTISVSDAPVRVSPFGIHSGVDITVQNLSDTDYVYIGGPTELNSENFGYRLSPGAAWSVELTGQNSLYAYADNPAYVAVLITGLEAGN